MNLPWQEFPAGIVLEESEGVIRGIAFETQWQQELEPRGQIVVHAYRSPLEELELQPGMLSLATTGEPLPTAQRTWVGSLEVPEAGFLEDEVPTRFAQVRRRTHADPCQPPIVETLDAGGPMSSVVSTRDGLLVVTSTGPFLLWHDGAFESLSVPDGIPRGYAGFHEPSDTTVLVSGPSIWLGGPRRGFSPAPSAGGTIISLSVSRWDPFELLAQLVDLSIEHFDGRAWTVWAGPFSRTDAGLDIDWIEPGLGWALGPSDHDIEVVQESGVSWFPFAGQISATTEGELEDVWVLPTLGVHVGVDEEIIYWRGPTGWVSFLSAVDPNALFEVEGVAWSMGDAGETTSIAPLNLGNCDPTPLLLQHTVMGAVYDGQLFAVPISGIGTFEVARAYWP